MAPFDPYHIWLGIPETEQPISKYRLLALVDFEADRDVISTAAERQTVFLRTMQAGEHEILVAQLLNEISQARVTLLNADQKAGYDEELREQQIPDPEAEPTPVPIPVVQTPPPTPVVVRGTVTQEFPVSVVQSVKRPRRKVPKKIWKRPVVIGSIRRECVDHMIVLNEKHLHRVLTSYFEYYHEARPHFSLDRNAPLPREIEPPSEGEVISIPQVGGLHHRYTRSAA